MSDPLAHLAEDGFHPYQQTAGSLFVSCSRKNRDFAKALYEKLTRIGFDLWRDVHYIPAGADDWWNSIKAAIDGCLARARC